MVVLLVVLMLTLGAARIEAAPIDLYLHGTGSNGNPSVLFLNEVASAATTAEYQDSAGVNFNGGNPWKDIGSWPAAAANGAQTVNALGALRVWIGLKNSDDQGTQFDLRAEVYTNNTLVASGQTLCITGVTRNANQAREVSVTPGAASNGSMAAGDILSVRM